MNAKLQIETTKDNWATIGKGGFAELLDDAVTLRNIGYSSRIKQGGEIVEYLATEHDEEIAAEVAAATGDGESHA